MNKYDIELAKIEANSNKWANVFTLLKAAILAVVIIWCTNIIVNGLTSLKGQSEEQLSAMAKLVESFQISNIVHYMVDGLCITGFCIQSRRAKRAIEEKAKYQSRAEGNDASRQSSGLTQTGDTPKT